MCVKYDGKKKSCYIGDFCSPSSSFSSSLFSAAFMMVVIFFRSLSTCLIPAIDLFTLMYRFSSRPETALIDVLALFRAERSKLRSLYSTNQSLWRSSKFFLLRSANVQDLPAAITVFTGRRWSKKMNETNSHIKQIRLTFIRLFGRIIEIIETFQAAARATIPCTAVRHKFWELPSLDYECTFATCACQASQGQHRSLLLPLWWEVCHPLI